MNERFLELPEDKRLRIINAGFEVFAQRDYKHASTEDIAAKAGISKGLLFYYFHDKRALYTFLFEEATTRIKGYVMDGELEKITDFFEYCKYAAERKYRLLCRSPYVLDFVMRAFYDQQEAVAEDVNRRVMEETAAIYATYFRNVDTSKFRDDVSPEEVFRMLTWLTEGYLHEQKRTGQATGIDEVMGQFERWMSYFKRVAYKEAYLG